MLVIHNAKQTNPPQGSLSWISFELKRRIVLSDRFKDNIEYKNVFDGKEALDILQAILNVERSTVLKIGYALEEQRFFHQINYEMGLMDDTEQIYQFYHTITQDYFYRNSSNDTLFSNTQDEYSLNGIYTGITRCYSPSCDGATSCYSVSCPNRKKRRDETDSHKIEILAHISNENDARDYLLNPVNDEIPVDKKEHKRQQTIREFIFTERRFVEDLEYIINTWIGPLQTGSIIAIEKRKEFIQKVFLNLEEIKDISKSLLSALEKRQKEQPVSIDKIGDIFLGHVTKLDPFIYYASRQTEAKHIFEQEKIHNPEFKIFARERDRNNPNRLDLNGYLTKPTTRLSRYPILLEKIISRTAPKDHRDQIDLPASVMAIKACLYRVNIETGKVTNSFQLELIHQHLEFKDHKKTYVPLNLLDETRQLVRKCSLQVSSSPNSASCQVILFDNYLVISKTNVINGIEKHSIRKKPIPIELLGVSDTEFPNDNGNSSSQPSSQQSINTLRPGLPVTFYNQGRRDTEYITLYAQCESAQQAWINKINQLKKEKTEKTSFFTTVNLFPNEEFFRNIGIHHMITIERGNYFILATQKGLYFGTRAIQMVPQQVLQLENIHQVQALEEFQLLLVLADETLYEFPLDVIIHNTETNESNFYFGRKVQTHVSYFHVGTCHNNKTIVCVPRPHFNRSTLIDIYEPLKKTEPKPKSSFTAKLSRKRPLLSSSSTQMVKWKELYNPGEVWAIDTAGSLVLLTTPMGMIAVNIITLKPDTLLDVTDSTLYFITKNEITKIQSKIKPLKKKIALFSVPNGNFLMCYDGYAFYIDKTGRRTQYEFLIHWEGQPTAFKCYYPHIIAFEDHFIEIRSAIDGHVEQFIFGDNIKCLQHTPKTSETGVFGVMDNKSNPAYHYVFELRQVH